jgi:hypothetical protein
MSSKFWRICLYAVSAACGLALSCGSAGAADDSGDPTPAATLSITVASDATETVNADHPIRWQVASIHNFTTIVDEGTSDTSAASTVELALDPGTYFVRAFIDADDDGTLSAGDTFAIHGLVGNSQRIFHPNPIVLADGEEYPVSLAPGVNEKTEDIDDIPPNFGVLYIFFEYAGTSYTVDADHRMYMGISSNSNLSSWTLGINITLNGEKVYAYLSAGDWYAGGFLDAGGNVTDLEAPEFSPGDPIELYDDVVYDFVNAGAIMTVNAGEYTDSYHLELDDDHTAPPT